MKNVQQISTMLPMGRRDDKSVCTTNFRPGARLITRSGRRERSSRNTCNEIMDKVLDERLVKWLGAGGGIK